MDEHFEPLKIPTEADRTFWKEAEIAYEQGPYYIAKFFFEYVESLGPSALWETGKFVSVTGSPEYIEETFFHFCKLLKHKFAAAPSLNYLKSGIILWKRARLARMKIDRQKKIDEQVRENELMRLRYNQKHLKLAPPVSEAD